MRSYQDCMNEVRQKAFEMGGLEDGSYHLGGDDLEHILQLAISTVTTERDKISSELVEARRLFVRDTDEIIAERDTLNDSLAEAHSALEYISRLSIEISDYAKTKSGCARVALQGEPAPARPEQPAEEFNDSQWWFKELEQAVSNGTPSQRRALEVVRNLLVNVNQNL